MRPESTLIRLKRNAFEALPDFGARTGGLPGEAENCGSHSATFQSPSGLRTRFRLGWLREIAPNSRRPRSRLRQRRLTVSDSARRKYSRPKRGSSLTVTERASSVGRPHKLKLYLRTSTERPKAALRRAVIL